MKSWFKQPIHARSLARISVGLVCALSTLACQDQTSVSKSELAHNVGQPTQHEQGAWDSLSDFEYYRYMLPLLGMGRSQILPSDHDLAKRAQAWLDLFHDNLKANYPQEARGIPRPMARVLDINQPNAFVGKVVGCYSGPTSIEGAEEKPDGYAAFLDFSGGELAVLNQSEYYSELASLPCKPLTDLADAVALAKSFNQFYGPDSCEMKVGASADAIARMQFVGDCGASAQVTKLYFMRVADQVHFFSGAFTGFSQEQFASVVAHELGHYYRAHGLEPASTFNYFYTQGDENHPEKPAQEHRLDSLIPRIRMSTLMIDNFSRLRDVAGQTLHSSLYFAGASLVQEACNSQDCPASCTVIKSNLADAQYMRGLGAFPFSDISRTKLKEYQDHEAQVMACLNDIEFTDREKAVTLLSKAVLAPSFPKFLVNGVHPAIDDAIYELTSFLQTFLKIYSGRHGGAIDDIHTMGGLLSYFDQGLKKMEGFAINLYDQVYEKKLGFYTEEQEADEISLEWMADVGVEPRHAVETYLAFTKYTSSIGTGSPFRDLEWDTCSFLFNNKWQDDNGEPRIVALGNLLDTHHGSCYRAFNTSREIKAHAYELKGEAPSLLTDGKWQDLVNLANNPGSLPFLPHHDDDQSFAAKTILGKSLATPCTYAPGKSH